MWPCCDITSSDDDGHNTDSNFLLLFADVDITPTLLEGLTEVDVLHIALGCRFALDIFTISQQYSPAPDHEPLPHDPKLFLFWALIPHRRYVFFACQLARTVCVSVFSHIVRIRM